MTFILTLGNSEQVIQISDRRVTVNGRLQDDESNKAGVLVCADARLAYRFTGLARTPGFETRFWLASALVDCGRPDFEANAILERLKKRATHDFQNLPALRNIPQNCKQLSVMFSGYLYTYDPPLGVYAILTNFQDFNSVPNAEARDYFECSYWREKRPRSEEFTFIQKLGFWTAMNDSDVEPLRRLQKELKPAKAIRGKAIEVMHMLADRQQARGTIGKQLSSIIVPRDPGKRTTTDYHPNIAMHQYYMPDMVYAVSEKNLKAIAGFSVEAVDPSATTPMKVPKVGRNQPCPCGSGKKYKRCHGQ